MEGRKDPRTSVSVKGWGWLAVPFSIITEISTDFMCLVKEQKASKSSSVKMNEICETLGKGGITIFEIDTLASQKLSKT